MWVSILDKHKYRFTKYLILICFNFINQIQYFLWKQIFRAGKVECQLGIKPRSLSVWPSTFTFRPPALLAPHCSLTLIQELNMSDPWHWGIWVLSPSWHSTFPALNICFQRKYWIWFHKYRYCGTLWDSVCITKSLIFSISKWLLCNWCRICSCNWKGIVIFLPFIAMSSMIASETACHKHETLANKAKWEDNTILNVTQTLGGGRCWYIHS